MADRPGDKSPNANRGESRGPWDEAISVALRHVTDKSPTREWTITVSDCCDAIQWPGQWTWHEDDCLTKERNPSTREVRVRECGSEERLRETATIAAAQRRNALDWWDEEAERLLARVAELEKALERIRECAASNGTDAITKGPGSEYQLRTAAEIEEIARSALSPGREDGTDG